jgi:hypothetical protein
VSTAPGYIYPRFFYFLLPTSSFLLLFSLKRFLLPLLYLYIYNSNYTQFYVLSFLTASTAVNMSSPESLPSSSFPSLNCTGLTIDPYLYSTPLLSESSESGNSTLSPPRSSPATRRLRTSWVFNHMPAEDPETIYLNKYIKVEWHCKYCPLSYATNRGNLVIKRHLLVEHGKTKKSSRENITAKRQQLIEHALKVSKNQAFKCRKLNTCGGNNQSISGGHLAVLYVKFITAYYLLL